MSSQALNGYGMTASGFQEQGQRGASSLDGRQNLFNVAGAITDLPTLAGGALMIEPDVTTPPTFSAMREFVCRHKAMERKSYTAAAGLTDVFLRELEQVDIVSFDIFDTLLLRYVDHPVDVFLHFERQPVFAAHRYNQAISRKRILAEQAMRMAAARLISSHEVNLYEIYQIFCEQNGISQDFAASFTDAEEALELRLCAPNPAIAALYDAARNAGKRVIYVSDTYHRDYYLLRLLQAHGYAAAGADLFASSALRKSKQSGLLFPHVLNAVGVDAGRMLHVGDHPVSDYREPKAIGIRSILHTHKLSKETPSLMTQNGGPQRPGDDSRLSYLSVVRGLRSVTPQRAEACGRGQDFWWKFGYAAAGPLTTGYCQWLQECFRTDGIEHAYFMLRDGALFHRVYQALFHDRPDACAASSLPASRRAALLPIVGLAPSFAVPSLLGGIGLRPMREYIERLGIAADAFAEEARGAGFSSLEERVDGRIDTQRLLTFFHQRRVMDELQRQGEVERGMLEGFLAQEGMTSYRKVALVDLGWGGTIHKALHVLLQQGAPETRLTGYYMATFPDVPHSAMPDLALRSYLAHRGNPAPVIRQIVSFLNLFETVYSSTEGSLLRFEMAPNNTGAMRIVAVRQVSDKSDEQCRRLEAMHDGAVAFALDYRACPMTAGFPVMPAEIAAEEFFRVIQQPLPEEARLLGELVHCDNLGSTSKHIAAALRTTSDPAVMYADYCDTHWKQGALSLPTPEGAALRTLVWLTQLADGASI